MDDNSRQSPDDALEPDDDIFDPTRDEEKLPEDNDSPAAPADDIKSSAPLDVPATDTGIDSDELYQEGLKQASDANDQDVGPDVRPRPLEPEDSDE